MGSQRKHPTHISYLPISLPSNVYLLQALGCFVQRRTSCGAIFMGKSGRKRLGQILGRLRGHFGSIINHRSSFGGIWCLHIIFSIADNELQPTICQRCSRSHQQAWENPSHVRHCGIQNTCQRSHRSCRSNGKEPRPT